MRDWLTHLPWVTRQSWPNKSRTMSFYAAGRQARALSKIVLHSTETTSWPGYRSGADNPHFTINLWTGHVRQHVPLSWGARALEIRRGNRLNNVAGVIQIEIIGACTPGYPKRHGHYDLPNGFPDDKDAQRYLARLLAAIHDETGIELEEHVDWIRYPGSYGDFAYQRLSTNQFLNYKGVLAHQHVPGNSHGDPGILPIGSVVLPQARELAGTPSKPRPKPKPTPPAEGELTVDQADRIIAALNTVDVSEGTAANLHTGRTGPRPKDWFLNLLGNRIGRIDQRTNTMTAEVAGLREAVMQIGEVSGMDRSQVEGIITETVNAATVTMKVED